MSNMYYEREPQSASREVACVFSYHGNRLTFQTDAGVFSKGELDQGTRLLLDALPELTGEVLDLGCGWGAIGIAVKKAFPQTDVTMVDVNLRALGLCERNAEANGVEVTCLESDGMHALSGRQFDAVITNPPIRAGKQKVYEMLSGAAEALKEDGSLYLVIRKQQGAESCMRFLSDYFETVEKLDRSAGFWVIRAAERK
ncbi:MAG: methyltransferase [Clostridia bacterium]|nr:methyltransferase [Clostridia bacterium]MBQ6563210.1 methyltransferase [Clostridia bacterium]